MKEVLLLIVVCNLSVGLSTTSNSRTHPKNKQYLLEVTGNYPLPMRRRPTVRSEHCVPNNFDFSVPVDVDKTGCGSVSINNPVKKGRKQMTPVSQPAEYDATRSTPRSAISRTTKAVYLTVTTPEPGLPTDFDFRDPVDVETNHGNSGSRRNLYPVYTENSSGTSARSRRSALRNLEIHLKRFARTRSNVGSQRLVKRNSDSQVANADPLRDLLKTLSGMVESSQEKDLLKDVDQDAFSHMSPSDINEGLPSFQREPVSNLQDILNALKYSPSPLDTSAKGIPNPDFVFPDDDVSPFYNRHPTPQPALIPVDSEDSAVTKQDSSQPLPSADPPVPEGSDFKSNQSKEQDPPEVVASTDSVPVDANGPYQVTDEPIPCSSGESQCETLPHTKSQPHSESSTQQALVKNHTTPMENPDANSNSTTPLSGRETTESSLNADDHVIQSTTETSTAGSLSAYPEPQPGSTNEGPLSVYEDPVDSIGQKTNTGHSGEYSHRVDISPSYPEYMEERPLYIYGEPGESSAKITGENINSYQKSTSKPISWYEKQKTELFNEHIRQIATSLAHLTMDASNITVYPVYSDSQAGLPQYTDEEIDAIIASAFSSGEAFNEGLVSDFNTKDQLGDLVVEPDFEDEYVSISITRPRYYDDSNYG